MWAKIEEQQGTKAPWDEIELRSHVAYQTSDNLEIATATIEVVNMTWEE